MTDNTKQQRQMEEFAEKFNALSEYEQYVSVHFSNQRFTMKGIITAIYLSSLLMVITIFSLVVLLMAAVGQDLIGYAFISCLYLGFMLYYLFSMWNILKDVGRQKYFDGVKFAWKKKNTKRTKHR